MIIYCSFDSHTLNFNYRMGSTALYVASQEGHDKVVKILVRARADLNLQSNVSNQTVASTYIQPKWGAEETMFTSHSCINIFHICSVPM